MMAGLVGVIFWFYVWFFLFEDIIASFFELFLLSKRMTGWECRMTKCSMLSRCTTAEWVRTLHIKLLILSAHDTPESNNHHHTLQQEHEKKLSLHQYQDEDLILYDYSI
jgi:hypothetical protein